MEYISDSSSSDDDEIDSHHISKKRKLKLPDFQMNKLDLATDNLIEYFKRFEAKCFIHSLDKSDYPRAFLNLLKESSEMFDFVFELSQQNNVDWKSLKQAFTEKFQILDVRTNALFSLMSYSWESDDTLESARINYTKLVFNSTESLDNVFIILFFIKSLPKNIYKNFVMIYKGNFSETWDDIYTIIKQAYAIENKMAKLDGTTSNNNHIAHMSAVNKKKSSCRFYRNGHCKKGNKCDFSHISSSSSTNSKSKPVSY
jgi:hypothetical protein